jgi:hypothetical protein
MRQHGAELRGGQLAEERAVSDGAARSRLLLISPSAHHTAMSESLERKTGFRWGRAEEGVLPTLILTST